LNIIINPPLFIGGFPDPRTYGYCQQQEKEQYNKPKLWPSRNRLSQSDSNIWSLYDSIT